MMRSYLMFLFYKLGNICTDFLFKKIKPQTLIPDRFPVRRNTRFYLFMTLFLYNTIISRPMSRNMIHQAFWVTNKTPCFYKIIYNNNNLCQMQEIIKKLPYTNKVISNSLQYRLIIHLYQQMLMVQLLIRNHV